MPTNNQIQKGHEHETGDLVTATSLNNIADEAVLLKGAISEQAAAAEINPSDEVLINDVSNTSDNRPRKATVSQIVTAVTGELISAGGLSVNKVYTGQISPNTGKENISVVWESELQFKYATAIMSNANKLMTVTKIGHGLQVGDYVGIPFDLQYSPTAGGGEAQDAVNKTYFEIYAQVSEVLSSDTFRLVALSQIHPSGNFSYSRSGWLLEDFTDVDSDSLVEPVNTWLWQQNPTTGNLVYVKISALKVDSAARVIEKIDPVTSISSDYTSNDTRILDLGDTKIVAENASLIDGKFHAKSLSVDVNSKSLSTLTVVPTAALELDGRTITVGQNIPVSLRTSETTVVVPTYTGNTALRVDDYALVQRPIHELPYVGNGGALERKIDPLGNWRSLKVITIDVKRRTDIFTPETLALEQAFDQGKYEFILAPYALGCPTDPVATYNTGTTTGLASVSGMVANVRADVHTATSAAIFGAEPEEIQIADAKHWVSRIDSALPTELESMKVTVKWTPRTSTKIVRLTLTLQTFGTSGWRSVSNVTI